MSKDAVWTTSQPRWQDFDWVALRKAEEADDEDGGFRFYAEIERQGLPFDNGREVRPMLDMIDCAESEGASAEVLEIMGQIAFDWGGLV